MVFLRNTELEELQGSCNVSHCLYTFYEFANEAQRNYTRTVVIPQRPLL